MDVFDAFAVIVDRPWLAALPAAAFALAASVFKARSLWIAAAAWTIYGVYELAVKARLLCSGECNIRIDLLLIVPVLIGLSVVALVLLAARVARERPR